MNPILKLTLWIFAFIAPFFTVYPLTLMGVRGQETWDVLGLVIVTFYVALLSRLTFVGGRALVRLMRS